MPAVIYSLETLADNGVRFYPELMHVYFTVDKLRPDTAAITDLIDANHWTNSRAYAAFPKFLHLNIGVVSELISFEGQELGKKSVGVAKTLPLNTYEDDQTNYGQVDGGW
ncbi:hypothetical protein K488DRAFT_91999 [Vararia minispora EC-137]|uniref:Uncharacterized protein n=1 Tax=Vararia minispora EC-137 TaxID=1314806 RepID=A0ACB8Q4X6_9AGAM|nr:hypothetical protein K488DRAFT_91999 [Vararia minispora EC-137]